MRRRPDLNADLRRAYREHVDAVYAFFAYSFPATVAEDLTSGTFERVVKSWHRYDAAKAGERTWILAIARNLLVDHTRRERHRAAVSTDQHPHLLDALDSAEDEYARRLDADELRGWLAVLAPREREVLALRYGADISAAEIAQMLDLSEANVHQIASRSLRRIRQRIGSAAG
jgi:RNA polymerase sigma-70 factor (ECF subfamily)